MQMNFAENVQNDKNSDNLSEFSKKNGLIFTVLHVIVQMKHCCLKKRDF